MKVYAIFDKQGDLIWAWPKKNGKDWIAGNVVEVEIIIPEGAIKKPTTAASMVKTNEKA